MIHPFHLIQSWFRQYKEIKHEDNCLQTSFVYEAYLRPKITKQIQKRENIGFLRRLSLWHNNRKPAKLINDLQQNDYNDRQTK